MPILRGSFGGHSPRLGWRSGATSQPYASVLNDLGMTLRFAGRFDEAEAAYARALEILEGGPTATTTISRRSTTTWADWRTREARTRRRNRWLVVASELRTAALGSDDPATLLDRSAHAAILDALGRSTKPRRRSGSASIASGDLGADHPDVVVALNNLAAIIQPERRPRRGRAPLPPGHRGQGGRLRTGSPELADAVNNLGTVCEPGSPGRASSALPPSGAAAA